MSATITVDQSQFQKALQEYVRFCKKSLPQIINGKAAAIAVGAYKLTPRADRGAVMSQLSLRVAKQVTVKKTGKVRNVYAVDDKRRIAGIMFVRDKITGKAPKSYAEYKAGSLKYAANRLTAIGTLAAGWIGCIKTLLRASGGPLADVQMKRVVGPGRSTPAVNGWNPTATFSYNLAERKPEGLTIDPRCQEALQQAFDSEAENMMQYIARKMQEKANEINAK